jgi:hypothetical protein
MATNRSTVRLAVVGIALLSLVGANDASSQTPRDHVVPMTARVSKKPLSITLEWDNSNATSITLYKRAVGQSAWGSPITVSNAATSYTDASVVVGTAYEYRLVRQALVGSSTLIAHGYLCSGIEVPLRESRGRVILVVDNTHATALAPELTRLERDLAGDGWTVVRRDVARDASVTSVKATIREAYDADRANTRSLFLFGHVPVPYSGNIAPDGHPDHRGAWPADVYYAEMTSPWTDTVLYDASQGRNRNEPGDGRFDQSYLSDALELEVGRVDLAGMNAFGVSETELLRRYLDKDHAYRHGEMTYASRALVDDNFGIVSGEAFASNAWRNFSGMVGTSNVAETDWLTTLRNETYLFGYGCGAGNYYGASGVATTTDFVGMPNGAVFNMLFGSYFGDWDVDDAFLRAPLATGNGLTSAWVGRPSWYLHPMAIGETIGAGTRLTQNNSGEYPTRHARSVHIALMGDPTLRLSPLRPPTNVVVTVAKTGEAMITWSASPEPGVTYNVYRGDASGSAFVKLNRSPLTIASFQARRSDLARTATYMVRAVGLTTTPSGSFFNASQGAYGEISSSTFITTLNLSAPSTDRAVKTAGLQ